MADPLNFAQLDQAELDGARPVAQKQAPLLVGISSSETLFPAGHSGIRPTHVGSQLKFTVDWLQCLTHPDKVAALSKDQIEAGIAEAAANMDQDAPQELSDYNTLAKLATNIDFGDFEIKDNFWQLTPENGVNSLQARLTQHAIGKPAVMLLLFDNSRVLGVYGQLGQQYVLVDPVDGLMHNVHNPLFALPAYIEKKCAGSRVAGVVMVPRPPKGKTEEVVAPEPEPEVEPEPDKKRKRQPEPEPEPEPEPKKAPVEEADEAEGEDEEEDEQDEEEQSLASMMKPTKRTRRAPTRRRRK